MSVKEASRDYESRGFKIVRLSRDESGKLKNPNRKGWTIKPDAAERFTESDGIGIMLGGIAARDGGYLVCIDLDSEEAQRLAPEILPATAMREGKPGKPLSHWYYLVTDVPDGCGPGANADCARFGGPGIKRFGKPAKIDFQGSGTQVAAPPSNGREWEGGTPGEPARVTYGDLFGAVTTLATRCGWKAKETKAAKPKAAKPASKPAAETASKPTADPLADWPMSVREARCRAYLMRVEGAKSGSGGHDATFRVAAIAYCGFGVTDESRLLSILTDYSARSSPPWTAGEIAHKIADVQKLEVTGEKLLTELSAWSDPESLAVTFEGEWRWAGDTFYKYTGTHYEEVSESEVSAMLWAHTQAACDREYQRLVAKANREHSDGSDYKLPVRPQVNRSMVANAMQALKARSLCKVSEHSRLIAFANGLFDPESRTLADHSPDHFGTSCLPYGYDADATCPEWLKTVETICGGDTEKVALVQEWFGYVVSGRTDLHKFAILTGEGGTGKTTVLTVLRALIGPANCSSVDMEQVGERFGLWPAVGKSLNICGDLDEIDKVNEGRLKEVTGEDDLTVDRKNREPWTGRLSARFIFATNTLPRFRDRSGGLWRRLILIPCDTVIPAEKRDTRLSNPNHWIPELPGIFNWALEGLARLEAAGRFTEPASVRELLGEYRESCNPAAEFMEERYTVGYGYVPREELYRDYREWSQSRGEYPLNVNRFSKEVARKFPSAEIRRDYDVAAKAKVRRVYGIVRRSGEHIDDVLASQPVAALAACGRSGPEGAASGKKACFIGFSLSLAALATTIQLLG